MIVPAISDAQFFAFSLVASASEEEEFNEIIEEQLEGLDTSEIDRVINDLNESSKDIFGEESFIVKIYKILSGDLGKDSSSILNYVINLFFGDLMSFLPIIAIVISVAILGSLIQGLKPKENGNSINKVINFVIYGSVVVLIFSVFTRLISSTIESIDTMKSQMDAVFPILLTLLTSVGGSVSVGVYQPAMAILSTVIINIFKVFLLPLFLLSCVLALVSNLSNTIKLDKMQSFFNSLF